MIGNRNFPSSCRWVTVTCIPLYWHKHSYLLLWRCPPPSQTPGCLCCRQYFLPGRCRCSDLRGQAAPSHGHVNHYRAHTALLTHTHRNTTITDRTAQFSPLWQTECVHTNPERLYKLSPKIHIDVTLLLFTNLYEVKTSYLHLTENVG